MNQPIQIMLVEDHPEYRDTVELALSKEPGMDLSHQFGTAERAIRSVQNCPKKDRPDIILLDLNLPGITGLESIAWFKESAPESKIIILTQSETEADILRAIALGASGYLLKSSSLNQIKEGIRTVATGGASLDSRVAQFILETLKSKLPKKRIDSEISSREMEVLNLLAEGLVKKEIAERLGISITTVVTHVSHIYEKLNVQNAPAAIARAFQTGIL